jgi:hypothetical protein
VFVGNTLILLTACASSLVPCSAIPCLSQGTQLEKMMLRVNTGHYQQVWFLSTKDSIEMVFMPVLCCDATARRERPGTVGCGRRCHLHGLPCVKRRTFTCRAVAMHRGRAGVPTPPTFKSQALLHPVHADAPNQLIPSLQQYRPFPTAVCHPRPPACCLLAPRSPQPAG